MAAFTLILIFLFVIGATQCSTTTTNHQSCEEKRNLVANWWNTFASMTWPRQQKRWWTLDSNSKSSLPRHPTLSVYLHKNAKTGDRVLMLSSDARLVDPNVYGNYRLVGRRFCISPVRTLTTPFPVYVYRKRLRRGKYDHLYTTNTKEIGTAVVGEQGKHGYRCLGILGFVNNNDQRHYYYHDGLAPIYRWYSRKHKTHLYSRHKGLGKKLKKQGFKRESVLGYTLQCTPF